MAIIMISCQRCGKKIEMYVGQTFLYTHIEWHASYRCNHCGDCIEMDWLGEQPNQEFVNAILEQDGTWEISINDGQVDKVSIMKVLRNELNMTISDLKGILKEINKFKFRGTKAEVAKFEYAFKNAGITTNIVRIN